VPRRLSEPVRVLITPFWATRELENMDWPSDLRGVDRVRVGPFAETKELIAGFTIIQVKSLQEAIEWVKRAPNLAPNGETEVEIRKLMDLADFGDEFTPNPEIAKVKFK
jgi:hypothetical protein